MASDNRTYQKLLSLQGLPEDFDLPGFTLAGKKRAIGNAVPLVLGQVAARAIRAADGLQ